MRISAFTFCVLAVLLAIGAAGFPGPVMARLIDYFIIQYPSISPNGDGIKDSSTVRIGLHETCTELLVTVEDRSTGNPLDTLLDAANAAPGTYETEWKGENSLGAILADGSYTIHLMASTPADTENVTRTVIIDTRAPLVALDRIEPGIYTPNVPGTPEKVLIYFSISQYGERDTLNLIETAPDTTLRTPIPLHGDGAYSYEWSLPASATDGIYGLKLLIEDEAGNKSADSGSVDVDTEGPTLSFINPPPLRTNQVPLALWGKCYDRNGVEKDSLFWDRNKAQLPDSSFMRGDTLVWRFDAIDSLRKGSGYSEGFHHLKIKCSDFLGHESDETLVFKLDLTPPARPTLNGLPAIVYEPGLLILGTVLPADSVKWVYVYRFWEGDTAATITPKEMISTGFAVEVTLREGRNRIWVVAEDGAGNMSRGSDTLTVRYETATGIFLPEVFRGADVFRVRTVRSARQVTIEIYTVSGELVATLLKPGPGTDFEFTWNLTNNDGENVRNGPYLAVFIVQYDNGRTVDKRLIAVVR